MLKPALTGPISKTHLARKSAEKVAARKAKHQPAYIAALHALAPRADRASKEGK